VIVVAGAAGLPASSFGDDPLDDLAAKERSATLELYALQTRLDRARAELDSLWRQAERVARERRGVGAQLKAARGTIAAAERFLALRLHALYEEGETDPFAVLLGAESLQDAIDQLDGLQFAAEQDRQVIERTVEVKRRLARLAGTLERRGAELRRLTAEAAARTEALDAARAERAGYVAQLKAERRSVVERVQAAREKTERLAVPVVAPTTPLAPTTGLSGRRMTVISTGYALPGTTATGIPVGWGVVAVDPSVIPLGTRMTIPGYGEGVAADTGSAVKGAKIDLWFPTVRQALDWGIRTVTITLHG
jgi:3D (Asp-Asp-Asp) domain-containing protein